MVSATTEVRSEVGGTSTRPVHALATSALVLALVSVAGAPFTFGLSLLIAPVAWVASRRAHHEIDRAGGAYGGRDRADAARYVGLAGVFVLSLWFVAVVLVALAVTVSSASSTSVSIDDGRHGPTVTGLSVP